jgi:arabinose-5-phosphate isomerase
MTGSPITISRSTLAAEALRRMEERKITSIVVVDSDERIEGLVHLHDLWRTQLF